MLHTKKFIPKLNSLKHNLFAHESALLARLSLDGLWCWLGEIWLGVSEKLPFICFLSLLGWLECLGVVPPWPLTSLCLSLHHSSWTTYTMSAEGTRRAKVDAIAPPKYIITSATLDSSKQVVRLAQGRTGINRLYSSTEEGIYMFRDARHLAAYLCKPPKREEWKTKTNKTKSCKNVASPAMLS